SGCARGVDDQEPRPAGPHAPPHHQPGGDAGWRPRRRAQLRRPRGDGARRPARRARRRLLRRRARAHRRGVEDRAAALHAGPALDDRRELGRSDMRTGFVGLGYIGKPMSLQLRAAGLETAVFDVVPAPVQELTGAGAKAAASPAEVAAASEAVGVCVQTDAQVRAVIGGEDGLLAGAKPGLVIAIHSTILPSTAVEMNALAAKQGVDVVDACVSGNTRAADPMFKLYVGGEPEQVE